MAAFTAMYAAIEQFPVPTIAVCVGNCVGAGAEIAAGADLRVGGDNLKLAWAGARLGVPVGPARLTPLVGLARAKDLVFTGRTVGADEAERLGLLQRVAPAEQAEAAALELAAAVAAARRRAAGDQGDVPHAGRQRPAGRLRERGAHAIPAARPRAAARLSSRPSTAKACSTVPTRCSDSSAAARTKPRRTGRRGTTTAGRRSRRGPGRRPVLRACRACRPSRPRTAPRACRCRRAARERRRRAGVHDPFALTHRVDDDQLVGLGVGDLVADQVFWDHPDGVRAARPGRTRQLPHHRDPAAAGDQRVPFGRDPRADLGREGEVGRRDALPGRAVDTDGGHQLPFPRTSSLSPVTARSSADSCSERS